MTERSTVGRAPLDGDDRSGHGQATPQSRPDMPASGVTPEAAARFRSQLTIGVDVVDPNTLASPSGAGSSMRTVLELVHPKPEARWVVFYSLGDGPDAGIYYDAHPIEQMTNHLTMLAYDMNGEPLSFGHGAPLRLRNETQLRFEQVKWIKGIEFVAHFAEVGGGYGGYNADHQFFGYRQTI